MSSPLKAVVDHHVDRPGVEAERSVQLTGTNRLIGLIALIADAHRAQSRKTCARPQTDRPLNPREPSAQTFGRLTPTISSQAAPPQPAGPPRPVLRRPGGFSEEPEPDPIPNSAVKLLSADGTMSQDLGE